MNVHRNRKTSVVRHVLIVVVLAFLAALASCATTPPTTNPTPDDAIIVSPTGDDATADGTSARPFHTLTAAVQFASAGDTIYLHAGVYTDDGGDESFPIDISDLTIEGEDEATTIVRGTLANGEFGLEAFDGTTTLRDLTVENHGDTAIWASGWTHAFTMERVTVRNTGYDSIEIRNGVVATFREVTIANSAGNNISMTNEVTLVLENSTLEDAEDHGLLAGGVTMVTVRGTSIVNNTKSGIHVYGTPAKMDLGSGAEAGGNTITGNGDYGLEDRRSSGATPAILAYGNTWDAAVSGLKTGPDDSAPVYFINETGNEIDFGP